MVVRLGNNLKAIATKTIVEYIKTKENLKKLAVSVLAFSKIKKFRKIDEWIDAVDDNPLPTVIPEECHTPFDVLFIKETDGTQVLLFLHYDDSLENTYYNPYLN